MAEKLESGGGAEIDPVLNALGPLGLFSIVQCCLFYSVYLTDAYQALSIVFIGIPVSHRCARPGNNSDVIITEFNHASQNSSVVRYEECSISIHTNSSGAITVSTYPCLYGMEYDRPKDASVMSEFDLVCEHAPLFSILHTAYSLGTGLGSFLFPALSDRYGRKRIMVVCQFLALTWFVAASFTPSYILLLVLKFAAGLCAPGLGLIAVTGWGGAVSGQVSRVRGWLRQHPAVVRLHDDGGATGFRLASQVLASSAACLRRSSAGGHPTDHLFIRTSKMADCCWQDQRVLEGYGKGRQVEPQEFPEVLDVFRDLQLEISASHKEAGNRRGTQTRVPWMQRPTKEQTLAPQLPWSEPFLQTRPNNRLQSGSSSVTGI
ncbi:solute carrier family 22 member 8-like isoform X2 [Pomacea canaliculata]|uniref:solute carrier family 22 member 8-like isoform X2 n=1 Tax=Pomacea canaliculata TaxID=400727 RepID=UPI000D73C031|nr:solute carrier family 22 member 8-like isoform X2 [Pomacea canaliculata]